MQKLEEQIQMLTQNPKMNFPTLPDQLFQEPTQNDFGFPKIGSFFRVNDANVAVITLGVILSSAVGGMLERWISTLGKWSTVAVGAMIMYLGKGKKMVRDFGVGVFIGGLASIFSGIGGSLGGMFGMPNDMAYTDFQETVLPTFGGSSGLYPVQPDRRVFA